MEETVSREIYEDSHTLLREILTEITSKIDVGLSFKFSASERPMSNSSLSIGAKVGADFEKKTMIKQVTEYTNTKVTQPSISRMCTASVSVFAVLLLCTRRTRAS